MHDQAPIDVTIVLFDGGYSSTAVAPLEVFHAAGLLWNRLHGQHEQPRFRVRSASIDGSPVTSTYGLGLMPQCAIDEVQCTDLIMLTSPHQNAYEGIVRKTSLVPWLRAAYERGTLVGGVCSGVAFVAESGLLDGRRATTHWALADTYRQRYPGVIWQPEHFVTEDAGIVCGGGMYASIDLSLYLVEKLCGHEVALECAKALVVSLPRHLQTGYGVVPLSRPHGDERVREAELLLQRGFDRRDTSLEEIAGQLAMSPRTLLRRFKAATGHVPGEYVHLLRVSAARSLLETGTAPVQKVAESVGYEDAASFRQIFKRHTGMTPADYRSRFGPLTVAQPALATADVCDPDPD